VSTNPRTTIVSVPDAFAAAADTAGSALAKLAFGSAPPGSTGLSMAPRHLALLPAEALELDLSDPEQRRFADYELVEKLGQGGMGVVYRARQLSLDRDVAIKLLSAGPWASADFIERFRREAQSAARMQHPNIVAIFEIGSQDELNFFSMRLVRGHSLAQVLAGQGAMAPRQAATLMRTIAEALDYAHRMGVLHLDLKPGNVMIDERGEPQVADFGLARRMDESLATVNDEVSGTPSYMAPEQAQLNVHKLSPATDIYGLGAILYELMTGSPPFLAATPQETLRRVVTQETAPPRTLDPRLPRDLEAVCMKCLAKDPARRYENARELAADLSRFLDARPVSVRPLNRLERLARWAQREPKLAALGALLLISLATGLGATSLQWQRAQANAATAQANAQVSNERLWEGRRETALRLEQAGSGFDAASRLLLNIQEREAGGDGAPATLERSHLSALLGQGVTLIDTLLIADANPLAVGVSPGGGTIAVALNDLTVRWFDARTLEERGRVDLIGQSTSEDLPRGPALLHFLDERRLRVTLEWDSHQISPGGGDSFLVDLERAALVAPPPAFGDLADMIFSADGAHALLRNRRAEVQLWQVDPWRAVSPLAPVTPVPQVQPLILGRGAPFAAYTKHASQNFEMFDPRNPARRLPIEWPAHGSISSWAESGDGKSLALGDNAGRVFVLDLATRVARVLPTPRGQDIAWLAFSEDDAWLAACGLDGAIHAFDVASGDPLVSGQMREPFELRRVAISRAQRLLIAAGVGQAGLWRLPDPSPRAIEARRLGTAPVRDALAGHFASAWSLTSGLLATVGVEGELRLWRLPVAPRREAQAPHLLSSSLQYDGKRVVDVAQHRVRLVAPDGSAPGAWLELAGTPGHAELVGGGRTLLVTVANSLTLHDAVSMRPRAEPIELPGTPQNLEASRDGRVAVLSFGRSGAEGFEERLQAFDLERGAQLPGGATLRGPLRQLALSADATRVLAVGPRDGVTAVLDARSLKVLGQFRHDSEAPAIRADFASEPDTLLLALRADDPRQQDDALVRWNYVQDKVLSRELLPQLRPVGLANTPRGPFLIGAGHDAFDPGGEHASTPERLATSAPTTAFAASPDGRLYAHGHEHEVQLYDAATLAPVGPPLFADVSAGDMIAQLAFAPDSRTLLARGLHHAWYLWPVAADSRAPAELGAGLAPLRGVLEGEVRRTPTAAERHRLRRQDPGAWPARAQRPAPAIARMVNGAPIPARAAGADPLLLDLTRVYNIAPDAYIGDRANMIATQTFLGTGIQRIDGIDYDIRGSVQLIHSLGERTPSAYTADRVQDIAVPPEPIAAFHVLLFAGHRIAEPDEREYARLRLHYRDGGSAVLPLRTRVEVPGWTEHDGPVPFGWAYGEALRTSGAPELIRISNPRLVNPHPHRIVASIDLEAGDETWNMPVFLAITAEPVIPRAPSRKQHTSRADGAPDRGFPP